VRGGSPAPVGRFPRARGPIHRPQVMAPGRARPAVPCASFCVVERCLGDGGDEAALPITRWEVPRASRAFGPGPRSACSGSPASSSGACRSARISRCCTHAPTRISFAAVRSRSGASAGPSNERAPRCHRAKEPVRLPAPGGPVPSSSARRGSERTSGGCCPAEASTPSGPSGAGAAEASARLARPWWCRPRCSRWGRRGRRPDRATGQGPVRTGTTLMGQRPGGRTRGRVRRRRPFPAALPMCCSRHADPGHRLPGAAHLHHRPHRPGVHLQPARLRRGGFPDALRHVRLHPDGAPP
jgi:hypothetical protein